MRRPVNRASGVPRPAKPARQNVRSGSDARQPSAERIGTAMLILIVVAAVGCYLNSLYGVLLFDDVNAIVENAAVRDVDLRRIVGTASWWGDPSGVPVYRPVTTLTFAINWALGGDRPVGYHVVNVMLHAAACVALAAVLVRVTGHARLATLAALLFAVHPVHTEAVASIVGRAEVLAAMLALLAWLCVEQAKRSTAPRWAWWCAAGLALALGILSKESAVTVIAAVVAGDLVYRRRIDVPGTAALAVGAAAALILRTAVLGGGFGLGIAPARLDNVLAGAPLGPRVLTAVEVIGRYARTLAWPFHLSADYSYPQIELAASPLDRGVLAGVAVLLGAAAAALWGWRRNRHVTFAILFMATTFSVASNLLVTIGTIMAERLLYLPSAGFCLLVACLGGLFRQRRMATVTMVALVCGLAALTVQRNRVWRDPQVFFETMVATAPRSARSHRELGLVWSRLGRHDAALAELQAALALDPGNAVTLYNLGNALAQAQRYDDAIVAYREAVERQPDLVAAIANLGSAYSARGDERAAEDWFRRGLEVDPHSPSLHMNLANACFRQGRVAEAEAAYQRSIALDPRDAIARLNYAAFLGSLSRFDDAARQYEATIPLSPRSPVPWIGLVRTLEAAGRHDAARSALARAERALPGNPDLRALRHAPAQTGGPG